MEFLGDVVAFFADPANWTGSAGILTRLMEHVLLSALAVAVAGLVAIPAGVTLGHLGRGGFLAVAVVNVGRAVPSFGVVALALPITIRLGLGLGFWPTFLALFLLAVPPMFTNTFAGVREVDRGVVEAARGMGLTGRQIVTQVEVPLALPVIVAGIRLAAVAVVATATLAALVAWGGLGRYIIDGFAQQDNVEVVVGAVLVALLAIATELAFSAVERWGVPRGVRRATVRTASAP